MFRIVIADDHGLYRRGLRSILTGITADEQIFEAQCFDDAVNLLEEKSPIDLAILDLHMAGLFSPDVLVDVLPAYPETRFMIVSGAEARSAILATLSAGLHGFVAKSQSDAEVLHAVQEVIAGRIYVPAMLSRSSARKDVPSLPDEMVRSAPGGAGQFDDLTPRQRDVLKLMADGFSNKEIARELDIAEATTKIHAAAVLRTLGVRNRTEAAVLLKTRLTKGGG
jgi:DNA-binding NarL/FixJ family response regulator